MTIRGTFSFVCRCLVVNLTCFISNSCCELLWDFNKYLMQNIIKYYIIVPSRCRRGAINATVVGSFLTRENLLLFIKMFISLLWHPVKSPALSFVTQHFGEKWGTERLNSQQVPYATCDAPVIYAHSRYSVKLIYLYYS